MRFTLGKSNQELRAVISIANKDGLSMRCSRLLVHTPCPYYERDKEGFIAKVGSYACIACSCNGGVTPVGGNVYYVDCRKE